MMKNKYTKGIYSYLFLACFAIITIFNWSCKKDFLDPVPKTLIKEEDAFSSPQRILAQVNGLYTSLKSGQHRGGRFLIYNDIRAEEFINVNTNGVTGYQTWQCNLTSSANEVENLWSAAYLTINRVNMFIKKLDENMSVVGLDIASNYKAEAKFIRALCYFDLLALYAKPYIIGNGSSLGLPLRLNAESNTLNNDLKRSTVAEVYDQILKDLNEAEKELPTSYAGTLNVTRAHVNTVIALKTRVYLAMGKYTEVVNEAKKIVSAAAPFSSPTGVKHVLQADITTVFTNYTTLESIFSMPMTTDNPPGIQNQLAYYYHPAQLGNGEYYLNKSAEGILSDASWQAADKRKTMIVVSSSNSFLTKFKSPWPYADYVPVIRYAEVLLNYAEALAQTGDLNLSFELLKAVRNRSDATYTFPATTNSTATLLTNAILTERRIELLGEGFRAIDLLRLGKTIPKKSNVSAVAPTDNGYIWPIPNSEMITNKLMIQN